MTVQELIAALQRMSPGAKVIVYNAGNEPVSYDSLCVYEELGRGQDMEVHISEA